MNFEDWKKMTDSKRKEISERWNIENGDGKDIAEAVLEEFIRKYGGNKKIKIIGQLTIPQGSHQWSIGVQCFSGFDVQQIPEKFMGLEVSRHTVDEHEDNPIFKKIEEANKRRAQTEKK